MHGPISPVQCGAETRVTRCFHCNHHHLRNCSRQVYKHDHAVCFVDEQQCMQIWLYLSRLSSSRSAFPSASFFTSRRSFRTPHYTRYTSQIHRYLRRNILGYLWRIFWPFYSMSRPDKPAAPQYPLYSWSSRAPPHCRLIYVQYLGAAEFVLSEPITGPLGFDLEWKPNFVKGQTENPVALVQLASADRIMLFQVTSMSSALTIL